MPIRLRSFTPLIKKPLLRRGFSKTRPRTYPSNHSVSRIFHFEDLNVRGYVHGGVILNFITEAGYLAASSHYFGTSGDSNNKSHEVVLVRIERLDFLKPTTYVEMGSTEANVVFTSPRSICVEASVFAKSLFTNEKEKKVAIMWFVPVDVNKTDNEITMTPLNVPQISQKSNNVNEDTWSQKLDYSKIYLMLKNKREINPLSSIIENYEKYRLPQRSTAALSEDNTSTASYTEHTCFITHNQCDLNGILFSSQFIKSMDEISAISAFRHCKSLCVTASFHDFNMYAPAALGDILNIETYPCYTSRKSFTTQAFCFNRKRHTGERYLICSSFISFVAVEVDKNASVPQLKPRNDYELKLFNELDAYYADIRKIH